MAAPMGACLLAALAAVASQASRYAGDESRSIKALPPEEVRALEEGHGMGLARAAELNHHPGPRQRSAHLEAHLKTRALLLPDQVHAYDRLRGYLSASTPAGHDHPRP